MAFALLFIWAMPAAAQTLYGSVVGQIEDPSGAAIVQSTITLTNKATGQVYEGKTDETGRFLVPNVMPGDYDLKVAATGFKTQVHADIHVSAAAVTRSDFKMEVGAIAEQITVEGTATLLQTDKSDTHTELNAKQVANLPLAGFRNYQSLINLNEEYELPSLFPSQVQSSTGG